MKKVTSKRLDEVYQRVLAELRKYGLLLESDPRWPSVVRLIAGEPVRGSWWGHPRGQDIFRINCLLADQPDVLVTKLVAGKVTFVHRRLWPAIYAVGTNRHKQPMSDLSRPARALLARVVRVGDLRTDQIRWGQRISAGNAASELETRLLVCGAQIHTEAGTHAKRLMTWQRWANQAGFRGKKMPADQAERELDQAIARFKRS